MASKAHGQKHKTSITCTWREILHVTQAPSNSPVTLEEVPRGLDWKFLDNQPPIDQSRRHHLFLKEPEQNHLLPGPAGIRAFCLKEHLKNMTRVNKSLDDTLKKSIENGIPASGCRFQCFIYLGKMAWFIDDKVLRHHQQQPLTLKSFSRKLQKLHVKSSCLGIREQFYSRAITDAEKLLKKLESVCKVPELEEYLYLHMYSKENEESMYRVKVTEDQVTGAFQLSAIWTPRTLVSTRCDFACFGRAHDIKIVFRCTTDEIPVEIKRSIEIIVNSCTRNKEGELEMILKTDKVVVGHVFERTVHKFPCDDWFVNYITYTDHFIDKEAQPEYVVSQLPPGHCCQDIQLMLQEIDYLGQEKVDEIKQKVFKMIDFSLDLLDMAEECLDPALSKI